MLNDHMIYREIFRHYYQFMVWEILFKTFPSSSQIFFLNAPFKGFGIFFMLFFVSHVYFDLFLEILHFFILAVHDFHNKKKLVGQQSKKKSNTFSLKVFFATCLSLLNLPPPFPLETNEYQTAHK